MMLEYDPWLGLKWKRGFFGVKYFQYGSKQERDEPHLSNKLIIPKIRKDIFNKRKRI